MVAMVGHRQDLGASGFQYQLCHKDGTPAYGQRLFRGESLKPFEPAEGPRANSADTTSLETPVTKSETDMNTRSLEGKTAAAGDPDGATALLEDPMEHVESQLVSFSEILARDNGTPCHFTFEHASALPRPSQVDQYKRRVERLVGQPINWWPLKPANPICPKDHTRVSWTCVSNQLFFAFVYIRDACSMHDWYLFVHVAKS